MIKYMGKKLIYALITILALTTITFLLLKLAPGDPVQYILKQDITQVDQTTVNETRAALNLDKPIYVQWLLWLKSIAMFDLGNSYQTGNDVEKEIMDSFLPTLSIALLSTMVVTTISIPLGLIAAYKKDCLSDRIIKFLTAMLMSAPSYFIGIVVIFLFSKLLNVLPSEGYYSPIYLVLPVMSVSLGLLAYYVRLVRSNALEHLNGKVAESFRLRGLNEKSIMLNDVLWPSIIPLISMLGMSFGSLLGGTIVIEYLFNIPGLGSLLVESIQTRDYPVIQGIVLLIGVTVIAGNLIADFIIGIISPMHSIRGAGK